MGREHRTRSQEKRRQRQLQAKTRKRLEKRRKTTSSDFLPGEFRNLPPFPQRRILARIKGASLEVITRVLRNLAASISSPEPFPTTFSKIPSDIRIPFDGSTLVELNWAVASLLRYSREITSFLRAKTTFENAFLVGDQESAGHILNGIRGQFGASFWFVEAGTLLAEQTGGLKANRAFLAEVQTENASGLASLFPQFLSQRAEKRLSCTNYNNLLDTFLKEAASAHTEILNYLRFRLAPYALRRQIDWGFAIFIETPLPVIDRYLIIRKILQILCSAKERNVPASGIMSIIQTMQSRIDDPLLSRLSEFLGNTINLRSDELQTTMFEVCDGYTEGRYAEVLSKTSQALLRFPGCFELYEFHARSALYAKLKMPTPFSAQSVSAEMLDLIFAILSKDGRMDKALERAEKLTIELASFSCSAHLMNLVAQNKHVDFVADPQHYAALHSVAVTPRQFYAIRHVANVVPQVNWLKQRFPQSSSVALFSSVVSNASCLDQSLKTRLPLHRSLKYEASSLASRREYSKAIPLYLQLHQSADGIAPIEEAASVGLFDAYLSTDAFCDCLGLVVQTYFRRPEMMCQFDLEGFLAKYNANGNGELEGLLAWPILQYIVSSGKPSSERTASVFAAYDSFLNHVNVSKPSQLADQKFSHQELIFFWRFICVRETMDCSIAFHSTDELESERMAICQRLLTLDQENIAVYSDEIATLTQSSMMRSSLQRLDESKVFIDTAGIAQSLDRSFRESYERYLAFLGLTERLRSMVKIGGVSLGDDHSLIIYIEDENQFKDICFLQFRQLFAELRNRFISSSEYGLDSYLSIRIRHGTLSGQIRSQFEQENLVTRKDADTGVYGTNVFWRDHTFGELGGVIAGRCDQKLRAFSGTIDGIIEEVKKKWIQIRGPGNNTSGLFDFDFSSEDIYALYKEVSAPESYQFFLDKCFGLLWLRTEANLERVRFEIRNTLKDRLTAALDILERDVCALDSRISHSRFVAAIARCRTQVQNELDAIAAWFQNVDSQSIADFPIRHLIDTAVATVCNCNPRLQFRPKILIADEIVCAGRTFPCFFDLLLILLDNVIRHAYSDSMTCEISSRKCGSCFHIDVVNSIRPESDLSSLRSRIQEIEKTAGYSRGAIKTEGGTGFHKLHKILRHDLQRDSDYKLCVLADGDRRFHVQIEMSAEGVIM